MTICLRLDMPRSCRIGRMWAQWECRSFSTPPKIFNVRYGWIFLCATEGPRFFYVFAFLFFCFHGPFTIRVYVDFNAHGFVSMVGGVKNGVCLALQHRSNACFLMVCFVGMLEHGDPGAGAADICGWFPVTNISSIFISFCGIVGAAFHLCFRCLMCGRSLKFAMRRADIWWSSLEPEFRPLAASLTSGVLKASGLCRFHFRFLHAFISSFADASVSRG